MMGRKARTKQQKREYQEYIEKFAERAKQFGYNPQFFTPEPPLRLDTMFEKWIAPAGPHAISAFVSAINYMAIHLADVYSQLEEAKGDKERTNGEVPIRDNAMRSRGGGASREAIRHRRKLRRDGAADAAEPEKGPPT